VSVEAIDLTGLAGSGGVVWSLSTEGFHTNLVVLGPGGSIGAHRNDELDVLLVTLAGSGTVTVDGAAVEVTATTAVLAPRGAERAIAAGPEGLRYLTIHGPRDPMSIGPRRSS
jgi:quercetin dioxygenase-like cupin family protein